MASKPTQGQPVHRSPPENQSQFEPVHDSSKMVLDASRLSDVQKAMSEVTTIPPAILHRTAALSWEARAVASYRVCAAKQALQEALSYFYLGEHYREAALAHAAMGEQWQDLTSEIEAAMAQDRAEAFATMRRLSTDQQSKPPTPGNRATARGR